MVDSNNKDRITIAILALGGQGGGVLADWILETAEHCGWHAQGTSVPGVAQRTGSTVYYVELYPRSAGSAPVFALMPVPGDVDVVIASELMEGGRAILRGFVSKERTTLISSLHRVYAISEKVAMGDGRGNSARIIEAAGARARQFIGFDMEATATASGSVISSVMLGALAGSAALPFDRADFENAIQASKIAVEANLRGFAAGFDAARAGLTLVAPSPTRPPVARSEAGRALAARIERELPAGARAHALHGVSKLMDYQDADYAGLYLDRLQPVFAADEGSGDHALTSETARYLALWMAYEDTIRVADLKVRGSRMRRVREEVRADSDQIVAVTEFMHPRLEEVCDTLPPRLGSRILASTRLTGLLQPMFTKGRHVQTTRLRWFLVLFGLSALRPWRRRTLRYAQEQRRIDDWLALVLAAAAQDQAAARELVDCQRLIKGYGDTFERGLNNFAAMTAAWTRIAERPDRAQLIRTLREAALADDQGATLAAKLKEIA